ncbi:MAG TPA: thiolase family protein [Nitrososphaerales archaeon]|nr:thiolase family protein [Nitrososphaerales archaeon]
MTLRDKAAIIGYGETPVSRARTDKGEQKLSVQEYFAWATELALKDAGLEKKDFDGQGVGVTGAAFPHSEIYSAEVIQDLGLSPRLLLRGDHGGASGAALLHQATLAVASGQVEMVLCIGADAPMNITTPGAVRTWRYESDFQKPFGMMGPNSQFAFILRRHVFQYGTKPEAMGKVAVVQRDHALKNPNAYMKAPLTMEQYFASRMIADPIRMFDACIPVNGGLAFIVASKEKAREIAKDRSISILGVSESDNYYHGSRTRPDITYLGVYESARNAFKESGVSHKDVSFFQPYDDYTIAVLMQIEDAGFCKKGDGGKFVDEHDISYRGDLPINTGGGQLSSGQPAMAGGFVHIVESVRQLRGEGGERQVNDAKIGVATGIGAISYGNSLVNSATMIFGRVD